MSIANGEVDFVAEIRLLTAEEGGRFNSIPNEYRPQLDMHVKGTQNVATINLRELESLAPGESAVVDVYLLVPEYQMQRLFPGFEFDVCEGSHVTGKGRITEVVSANLQRPS